MRPGLLYGAGRGVGPNDRNGRGAQRVLLPKGTRRRWGGRPRRLREWPGWGGRGMGAGAVCGRPGSGRDDRNRLRGRREQADVAHAHFEGDPRTVGLADVDGLPVVDIDDGHPLAVEVDPVQRVVVDREPPRLIEAQLLVRSRVRRVRSPQVATKVTSYDPFRTGGE